MGVHHARLDALRTHQQGPMFTLAEGYVDLDGIPFQSYYCDMCVEEAEHRASLGAPPEVKP